MDVNIFTVCDSTGRTDQKEGDIVTVANEPYRCYIQLLCLKDDNRVDYDRAVETETTHKYTIEVENEKTNITTTYYYVVEFAPLMLTMPLGGTESGFFRYPRVGEQVLAGRLGDTIVNTTNSQSPAITLPGGEYVLMGYMPHSDTANCFYPYRAKNNENDDKTGFLKEQQNPGSLGDFKDDYGMALRYNQTAVEVETETVPDQKVTGLTEIGFYRKQAKWPNKTPGERKSTPPQFASQDAINIQSTGDIESRAENYQLLKAKRFEILVNTDELSPKLRYDNANSGSWDDTKAPVGDSPLDDPMIHAGDLHVRAGRNITIKANNEIRLQVGRTTVVISDGGFNVVTQKTNSGVGLSYDTAFSMSPRNGINMSGQKINVSGVNGFSIGDSWGAGVNGSVGGLAITGRFIKLSNMDTLASAFMLAANTVEAAQNISESSAIITTAPSAQEAFAKSVWWFNLTQTLIKNIESVVPLCVKAASFIKERYFTAPNVAAPGDAQPGDAAADAASVANLFGNFEYIEMLTLGLKMLLDITSTVYTSLEATQTRTWQDDVRNHAETGDPLKYPPTEKSKWRDQLNTIALSVDNGLLCSILDVVTVKMVASGVPGSSADLRLRPSGDIVISAAKYINQYCIGKADDATVPSSLKKFALNGAIATSGIAKLTTDIEKAISSKEVLWERVKPWFEKL